MFEGLFVNLKNVFKANQIQIDGKIFKLHYRFTTLMLILACIMVTGRQYFGDPIQCMPSSKDEIPKDVLESYCWIHSTYTLPRAHLLEVGVDTIHPGIDRTKPGDEKMYYKYYQWVCFVLFFQAMFFYVPHYLWKCMEHGILKKIVLDLNIPVHEKHEEHREMLAEYVCSRMHDHRWYALKYYFCEVLNFINVIIQIHLVDDFLGGEFLDYGTKTISFSELDQDDRSDPMIFVFPRVTKCLFRKNGPTGDIQLHDALCILPLNVINEKIFILMWFWFVILATVTGANLLYNLPITLIPRFRHLILKWESAYADDDSHSLYEFMNQAHFGDWFLMRMLGRNLDPIQFRRVLKMVVTNVKSNKALKSNNESV